MLPSKSSDISINTILIYGLPRNGKTLLALLLSSDKKRVISNFKIFLSGIQVSKDLKYMSDFDKLEKDNEPGYLIVDEMGANFNSLSITTKKYAKYRDFLFLQGKYNLSHIGISQRFMSCPKDLKDLANYIYEVEKVFYDGKTQFQVSRMSWIDKEKDPIVEETQVIDIFYWLSLIGYSYNTFETSLIIDDIKKTK